MARKCDLLGKKTTSGNNRPFSMKATKRTFRPNLFKKRVLNPFTGKIERMQLSAKAIRTLKKWLKECETEVKLHEAAISTEPKEKKDKVKKEKKLTPKQKKELAAKEAEVAKGKVSKAPDTIEEKKAEPKAKAKKK